MSSGTALTRFPVLVNAYEATASGLYIVLAAVFGIPNVTMSARAICSTLLGEFSSTAASVARAEKVTTTCVWPAVEHSGTTQWGPDVRSVSSDKDAGRG